MRPFIPFVRKMNEQVRAGRWMPIAAALPALTNGIANRWEGLPAYAEDDYFYVMMRIIEIAPEKVLKTFNEAAFQEITLEERRYYASAARESLGIYGFKPRELEQMYQRLLAHLQSTEEERENVLVKREYEAYVCCAQRFLDFCAWLQINRERDAAFRTSVGHVPAPVEAASDAPQRPKLVIVR